MERLKRRAQDDGKQVFVENDRLLIDGTAVFSLSHGFLNDHSWWLTVHSSLYVHIIAEVII